MIIRNKVLETIRPFMGRPVIKVLTGLRRSGKSCLLGQIREEVEGVPRKNVFYIDMELAQNFSLRKPGELDLKLESMRRQKGPKAIFIDEVQEIPEWERSVNGLLKEKNWDIYLTGSNAHLLSSELATLIAGRYVEIPVYPLGYREFLEFSKTSDSDKSWLEYLQIGGLPGIHELPEIPRVRLQYLQAIQDTIVLKDVIERNSIREPKVLESVIDFVYDNIGSFTTAKTMSEFLKSQRINISIVALQGYLRALESSYAIHQAKRYDIKGRRLLEVQSKYFVADLGLRFARLGPRDRDISGLLENVVYLELRRRGFTVHVGRMGQFEVDFVAIMDGMPHYYQVALTVQESATREREFRSLEMIPDQYPKTLLSLDPVESQWNGIQQLPIRKFLLQ